MDKRKKLDKILNVFLTREVESTDARILSLRHFLQTLEFEAEREFKNQIANHNNSDDEVIKLMNDMIVIYQEEIDTLIVKRNKISTHLSSIKVAVQDNNIKATFLNNIHLN